MAEPRRQTAVRAFSFGGGTQSMAALILAARGEIDFRLFLFANVGEDSELPETLDYVRDVAFPYAAKHGIELVECSRSGKYRSLMDRITRLESSVPIPMRMDRSGKPGNRTCTIDFKIAVCYKELRRRGATRQHPATIALGISTDEYERAKSPLDPKWPAQLRTYPLLDARLSRHDCSKIIAGAGLPQPPRSACWFCPFHSGEEWKRLQRKRPDLFEQACELEEMMQARRKKLGKDSVWLTDKGAKQRATLRVLHAHEQLDFDTEGSCDGGYCMT
jgi:hypothetical protein